MWLGKVGDTLEKLYSRAESPNLFYAVPQRAILTEKQREAIEKWSVCTICEKKLIFTVKYREEEVGIRQHQSCYLNKQGG